MLKRPKSLSQNPTGGVQRPGKFGLFRSFGACSKSPKRCRCVYAVSFVASCLLLSSGCQTWHASSAIPGLNGKKGEKLVLQQAKNDPFPSPSDVGLTGMSK